MGLPVGVILRGRRIAKIVNVCYSERINKDIARRFLRGDC